MSFRQCVPASNDENVTGAAFKADLLVRPFKRRRSSSIRAPPRAPSDGKLLQHCNATLSRRSPVPNERMTIPLGSAVYPGQESTMEVAFAIALPAFIAGVFYLALWLQWQPG
jgi:hypothetical protein